MPLDEAFVPYRSIGRSRHCNPWLVSTATAGGRPERVLAGLKAGRAHQTEIIVKYRDGADGVALAGYASYNGTSMATPHVTGAAALYKSSHAGATAADVKAAILGSAVTTPSLQGKVVTNGRLNATGF